MQTTLTSRRAITQAMGQRSKEEKYEFMNFAVSEVSRDVCAIAENPVLTADIKVRRKKGKEMFYLTTHSTHFIYSYMEREREMFYLTMHSNTFYLWLYGVGHIVKDHLDSERGKPLPPHGLLFSISSKGCFICTIPQTG